MVHMEAMAWSGNSWVTAKHSIKNAVGTVANNGAIYVAPGTYNEQEIDIKKNITIIGTSTSKPIIKKTRLIIGSGCKVNIKGLTFLGTESQATYGGGAIYNEGSLTVTNSIFKNNDVYATKVWFYSPFTYYLYQGGYGGSIVNYGPHLNVNNCTFTLNFAYFGKGGAIYNSEGMCKVINSIFTNNWAGSCGGALWNGGVLDLTNSIFINNAANGEDSEGGAIRNDGGTLTAHFNQFIGDTATKGKEIYNDGGTVYATSNWWGSNNNPTSKVYGGVSVTPWELYTKPKVTSNYPKNGATGISRTATIYLRFNELIKTSINWSKIVVKDKYGHAVSNTKWISGNTLNIQTGKRLTKSYYTIYIPRSAVKDYAGDNLATTCMFKFRSG